MANVLISNLNTTTTQNISGSHYLLIDNGTATTKTAALSVLFTAITPATGTGANLLKTLQSGILTYRTIKGTGPITVTENVSDVTVGFDGTTIDITTLNNIENFNLNEADNSTSLFLKTVNLTSNVTGTLPIANGGTGKTSFLYSSVLLGGATVREAVLNSQLKFVVGTAGGPEVKTLVAGNKMSVVQNDVSNTVTVAVDDTDIAIENTDVTFADVTVDALTVGSLSAASAGAVTQTTSLSTGVTLNVVAGSITLYTAAITADTNTQFVVTNSKVTLNSVIFLSKEFQSNAAENNGVHVSIASVSNGNFTINVTHTGNQNAAAVTRKIHFFVFG
jgi:hypothetical protein